MTARIPMLTIVGDVGIDLVLGPVEGWPPIGTEVIVPASEMRLGGSAGNCFLAMHALGAGCRLLSKTGHDELGTWLASRAGDLGGSLEPVDAATSMTTAIIHECGERSFFTTQGHLERIGWDDLSADLQDASDGDILLLTGAFLLPRLRQAYPTVLPQLRRRGYRIALDLGWPPDGWTSATQDEVSGWLTDCDHLLLNEAEVMALGQEQEGGRAMAVVATMLPATASLVMKTGARGAVGLQNGTTCSAAAPQVVPFDTIGAGDSFNAGYLHARLTGQDLQASLQAGCTLASSIISRFPRHTIGFGELASALG